jgi:hypothetical protein
MYDHLIVKASRFLEHTAHKILVSRKLADYIATVTCLRTNQFLGFMS